MSKALELLKALERYKLGDSHVPIDEVREAISELKGLEQRILELEKPKLCNTCAFDHCGCSVQDSILQIDPKATFETFGCIKHEVQLCKHKFEWADGSISTCYLPFGHGGQCNGTVYGAKCYFPKEFSSYEEAVKAEWELPQC